MPILPHQADALLDKLLLGLNDELKDYLGLALKAGLGLLTGKTKVYRYPLYILDFDKIAAGNLTSSANLVGWRFLVDQPDQHSAVDFRLDANGKYQLHSINTEGPIPTLRAQIDALQVNGDYRVADLEIPGIGQMAFWLQPAKPNVPPLICPIQPTQGGAVVGAAIPAATYEQQVQQVASSQGSNWMMPPPTGVIPFDVNLAYNLSNEELGDSVVLDGIAAMARPAMKPANGSDHQKWRFTDLGGGYYRIQCVGIGNGSALEGGAKDLGSVMIGTANQTGQMWRPIDAGNGYYFFVNMFTEADNYALHGGALNAGALISRIGLTGHKWKLTVAP